MDIFRSSHQHGKISKLLSQGQEDFIFIIDSIWKMKKAHKTHVETIFCDRKNDTDQYQLTNINEVLESEVF